MRAKMQVFSVKKTFTRPGADGQPVASMELSMSPVCGTENPNKAWNTATPSGELRLVVNNPECFPFIESMPGKEFYIDISEA